MPESYGVQVKRSLLKHSIIKHCWTPHVVESIFSDLNTDLLILCLSVQYEN